MLKLLQNSKIIRLLLEWITFADVDDYGAYVPAEMLQVFMQIQVKVQLLDLQVQDLVLLSAEWFNAAHFIYSIKLGCIWPMKDNSTTKRTRRAERKEDCVYSESEVSIKHGKIYTN